MKAKTKRNAMRWFHLISGSIIATYIYSPWHEIAVFQGLVKSVILPLLILSGLWLWKGHHLRKVFSKDKSLSRHSLVLLFVLSGFPLVGQTNFKGGSGSFDIGMQALDVNSINQQIQGVGFPALPNLAFTMGGSGEFYIRKFVLGGEGGFIGQGKVSNGSYDAQLAGGHGLLSLGYLTLVQKGWLLYPSLGLGVSGTGFSLTSQSKEYSFTDVLNNPEGFPNQEVEFGQASTIFRLAIRVEKFLLQKDGNHFGPKIGLVAGYTLATRSTFRQNGIELEASPDFAPRGFFLTLKIGGGYIASTQRSLIK